MQIDRRGFLVSGGVSVIAVACRAASRPPVPAGLESRRVVVVGAGLAGLTIAHELMKQRVDVVVIEATRRAGGRIRTIRGFSDGLYVEAGAAHLVPDPDLLALCGELGVKLADPPAQQPPLARVSYRDGRRRLYGPGEEEQPELALSAEEAQLDEEARMARYLGIADHVDPRSFEFSEELAKLDHLTCADWLRGMGASPGFVAELEGMASGDGVEAISALEMVRTVAAIKHERALAGRVGRVAGGTDALPLALAARLGDRIAYGSEVVRIEHSAGGATLVVADGSGQHRIDAARVVLTMPFTVLRRIEVAPKWSLLKARAITELGMSSVTRIWVASRRRYWIERGESGRVDSDLPSGSIRDETDRQPGTAGVLGVYATGVRARTFAALSPEARVASVIADIERVHPGFAEYSMRGDSLAWDQEPFARGAYGTFMPGQLTTLARAAAAPEGVIHFAGDGTSYRPGFMHGAIASARRVITELLERP